LTGAKSKEFATKAGTKMHAILQRVVVDDTVGDAGDGDIVKIIKSKPELMLFFGKNAKTEVPIAGRINGVFVSRRIDRLLLNHDTKTVWFVDYKTDLNKTEFVEKYKKQLNEYATLLKSVYPDYVIKGYILWLCDWSTDKIIG